MRYILLALLLATLNIASYAQIKTEKEIRQEKSTVKKLIRKELIKVPRYSQQPIYYLDLDKVGCRIVVKIDEIPVAYYMVEDRKESCSVPINAYLLGSGEHVLSMEVYPLSTQTTISTDARARLAIVLFHEKDRVEQVGMKFFSQEEEWIAKLSLPRDVRGQNLPVYCDSIKFRTTLPFDYSHVLTAAKDLRKIPDLESKVYAYYNKVRDMMIAGEYYEYIQMLSKNIRLLAETNYWTKNDLEKTYLRPNDFFRFNCHILAWKALPIENCEMVIDGKGKLVYLRFKDTMSAVLRVEYYTLSPSEIEYGVYDKNDLFELPVKMTGAMFIVLYMPHDSDELMELLD